MEKLLSSWYNLKPLPDNYIFPPEERPGKITVPLCENIPVIDLGQDAGHGPAEILPRILQACQDFGFFQVINHGVSENLMDETMSVFKEFFEMAAKDKASAYSDDPSKSCRLYTSSVNHDKEKHHFWRDCLRHPCHPLEDWVQFWPEKPTKYREVVGSYSIEVRKLSLRILDLICEILGLEPGYFEDELSKELGLTINHYPPCPEPSLTLGVPKHCDPDLITILQQGKVCGLQVHKDEQWIGIKPLPHAFVVNVGYLLQIISNGKLRSVEHRAVTNSSEARTTIATFINPSYDCVVEPAKALVNACSPPLYRAFKFKEFLSTFAAINANTENVLAPYKL